MSPHARGMHIYMPTTHRASPARTHAADTQSSSLPAFLSCFVFCSFRSCVSELNKSLESETLPFCTSVHSCAYPIPACSGPASCMVWPGAVSDHQVALRNCTEG
ncbi:hypothetical protein JZ751_028123 [Albula glossodonta]|uniref:Uncharacterized protein n=1 Tax=Albula glossodonta TaxID=121402 RepID=A0A8T2PAV7_9TELE|nr:hypothetical protein JZ751_028123 [Albula glossodonta]